MRSPVRVTSVILNRLSRLKLGSVSHEPSTPGRSVTAADADESSAMATLLDTHRSGMQARDLMTSPVETVSPNDDVAEVLTRLARANFNGYPVVEDGRLVGIVTQGDLVDLFQPSDRTLWIPIGFPPFLESLEYAVDLSWDELDVGVDLVRNAGRPIREVMTTDVVSVRPEDDLDRVLALLADDERDINRLPVVESDGSVVGIIARQDVLRVLREERLQGGSTESGSK